MRRLRPFNHGLNQAPNLDACGVWWIAKPIIPGFSQVLSPYFCEFCELLDLSFLGLAKH
jgi:hypothetical protein